MSDRPFVRQLIRLAARLTGQAHRQDMWPGLAIDRAAGQVTWRGKPLLTLVPFAAIVQQGLPLIAVVGSGPSLAAQAPAHLPPRTAILLNGAATLADRIQPLAVMVEDERFVFRHMEMLSGLPRDIPLMLSSAVLRAMVERDGRVLTGRPIALIDNLTKPVNHPRRKLTDPVLDALLTRDPSGAAMTRDPDAGVVIFGTVALSAVQVALAANPQKILLAGIDLTNAASGPRFYESATNSAPSGIVAGLNRILAGFEMARAIAQAQGVEITCASPVSALLDLGYQRDTLLDLEAKGLT
jgi:hypothetical protein